jgi:hypothetical protein
LAPIKKVTDIIGQIIYYITDLKNAPLLDYGSAVTQRIEKFEKAQGVQSRLKRK